MELWEIVIDLIYAGVE
jgi:hypothetical protein